MQINNPFQINDWEIGKFLKVVLAIQLAVWGVIGLDAVGIQIPILRQLIGFVYLTFVPGILILRILKLHKLGNIETILYTVGLSIATLMFTGLFMNTVYPFLGISGPISIVPLIITISVVVMGLSILGYKRDKDFSYPSFIDVKEALTSPVLFLCLIPFLAILGTYLVNFHHTNILLLFLIVIIAGIVALAAFDIFIPKKLYPLAVVAIAIAILYHRSLISMYLTGTDIYVEYAVYKTVVVNAYWSSTAPSSAVNSMLSCTLLPAIYSHVLNLDGVWVFKIIYPFIFSLVPLGLYRIYEKQIDEKAAFLSVFFFMSFFTFFGEMLHLARQQIAELFFVLVILLIIDKEKNTCNRKVLFILFSISLIISHYALSYIYMFYVLLAVVLLFFIKDDTKNKTLTVTYIALYFVMALAWYMHISNSVTFNQIVHIGDHMFSSISNEFFVSESRDPRVLQAIGLKSSETSSFQHEIAKYIHHITHFFILVGVFRLIVKRKEMKFNQNYIVMTFISLALLLMSIVLPYFAGNLNMTRLFHITLIILSPYCIIGGFTVFEVISRLRTLSFFQLFKLRKPTKTNARFSIKKKINPARNNRDIYKGENVLNSQISIFFILIILIPYFLFNTGFIFEVSGDSSSSIALSLERLKTSSIHTAAKVAFYVTYVPEQNVFSAQWLLLKREEGVPIQSDGSALFTMCYCKATMNKGPSKSATPRINKDRYLYLTVLNVVDGLMVSGSKDKSELGAKRRTVYNTTEILAPIKKENKLLRIYTNGYSEVYYIDSK